ncbi:hypothetical protein L6452_44510 [Arctium lappa]|uniref:Uncharacterized protein n=1 Tax=Arctium lappa TaxID=4217 RepID=A0ACB8XJY9_ARCLA|nr:hypothetical protein L6452_44510 [Arctium lappa]
MARQKHLVSRPSQPPRRSLRRRRTITPSTPVDSADGIADAAPPQTAITATSTLSSTNIAAEWTNIVADQATIAVAHTSVPPPQTTAAKPTSSISSTQGIFTSGGSPTIPSFDAPTKDLKK